METGRKASARVANIVIFKAVYVACVLGALHVSPWLGPAVGALLLPLERLMVDRVEARRVVVVVLLAGTIGTALDSALRATDLLGFSPETLPEGWPAWLAPPWIACLWFALGTLMRSSLAWLGRLPRWLQAAFGAGTGVLSFWSASKLGVTELPRGGASIAALAIEYAVVVPILLGTRPPEDALPRA
ncbi:MAG: DUF2878 domain-containing protein [Planctomycetota bacterium]